MNIEQAIDIVYTGFIGKDSVPDQLKSSRKLDLEKLGERSIGCCRKVL